VDGKARGGLARCCPGLAAAAGCGSGQHTTAQAGVAVFAAPNLRCTSTPLAFAGRVFMAQLMARPEREVRVGWDGIVMGASPPCRTAHATMQPVRNVARPAPAALQHGYAQQWLQIMILTGNQMPVLHPHTHQIAVVTHSSFVHYCLTNYGHEASTAVQGDLHRRAHIALADWGMGGWQAGVTPLHEASRRSASSPCSRISTRATPAALSIPLVMYSSLLARPVAYPQTVFLKP
jgi:hypothetical protein